MPGGASSLPVSFLHAVAPRQSHQEEGLIARLEAHLSASGSAEAKRFGADNAVVCCGTGRNAALLDSLAEAHAVIDQPLALGEWVNWAHIVARFRRCWL